MAFHQTSPHSRSLSTLDQRAFSILPPTHHSHFVFCSKPLFILHVYTYVCIYRSVCNYKLHEQSVWFESSIHHHRHLSIFIQFSECFFAFFSASSIFILLIHGYIVIAIRCTSIHTISIRRAFTAPDLILRSVCCTRCCTSIAMCCMQCTQCALDEWCK